MILLDSEKCTGCGTCIDSCPAEAIFLVDGKAAINPESCSGCAACVQVCPEGCISEEQLSPNQTIREIQVVQMPTIQAAQSSPSKSRPTWVEPILSYVGSEILPRIVEGLLATLDSRLNVRINDELVPHPDGGWNKPGRRRRVRRRRRSRIQE